MGPTGTVSHRKVFDLITAARILFPCELTQSQVLGIGIGPLWGLLSTYDCPCPGLPATTLGSPATTHVSGLGHQAPPPQTLCTHSLPSDPHAAQGTSIVRQLQDQLLLS